MKIKKLDKPDFEKEFYKIADKIFEYPMKAIAGLANLMIEHPLIVGAATVTGIGMAADVKFNDSKITNKVFDYAKNPGKAIGGAAFGVFGIPASVGDYFKGNQPPVIENIIANRTDIRAGDSVEFSAKAFDPDGKIAEYNWQILNDKGLEVAAKTTPSPALDKVFAEPGNYIVKLKIDDAGGKSAVKTAAVEVGEKVKLPRNDIKVVLGTTYEITDDVHNNALSGIINVAKYLNESQKVPNENIKILIGEEFTYENFVKTIKNVGMNASDNDTIIINPVSHAGIGIFSFSDGKFKPNYPYKVIAEAIKSNTNPNAKKVIIINGCYSGSAIPIFEEVGISNTAVYTSTTATTSSPAISSFDNLLTGNYGDRIDYNKDGKISLREMVRRYQELAEQNFKDFKPEDRIIPHLSDPNNITDELFLVDE